MSRFEATVRLVQALDPCAGGMNDSLLSMLRRALGAPQYQLPIFPAGFDGSNCGSALVR